MVIFSSPFPSPNAALFSRLPLLYSFQCQVLSPGRSVLLGALMLRPEFLRKAQCCLPGRDDNCRHMLSRTSLVGRWLCGLSLPGSPLNSVQICPALSALENSPDVVRLQAAAAVHCRRISLVETRFVARDTKRDVDMYIYKYMYVHICIHTCLCATEAVCAIPRSNVTKMSLGF